MDHGHDRSPPLPHAPPPDAETADLLRQLSALEGVSVREALRRALARAANGHGPEASRDGQRSDGHTPAPGGAGRAGTDAVRGVRRDAPAQPAPDPAQLDFLAMIGHELRTPLTSLYGFAQLMRERGRYDAESLDIILGQSRRIRSLIDDLVDTTRLRTGQLSLRRELVDLVALTHTSVHQVQALEPGHTLRVETPERPLMGHWDPYRLGQVLQNLLTNAIKYSPNGGAVLVRVEDGGPEARVSVRDEGLGVAAAALPRLFERYYRADRELTQIQGLGLGLYIAKLLVEAHGGYIWAESDGRGTGSIFTFALPRDEV